MQPGEALAEDLRRFGLILLAAAIVGGFMRAQVGAMVSVLAALVGVALLVAGYWCHHTVRLAPGEDQA